MNKQDRLELFVLDLVESACADDAKYLSAVRSDLAGLAMRLMFKSEWARYRQLNRIMRSGKD